MNLVNLVKQQWGIGETGSRIHGMDESRVRFPYPPPATILNSGMKYGFFADDHIPDSVATDRSQYGEYKVNSHGYRCPEWEPLPDGKKNVVILGCSHTFGIGLEEGEVWVDQLYRLVDKNRLRFWNLAVPGASADLCTRILYATEKVLFPKIVIVCWPASSRRERLDQYPKNLTNAAPELALENNTTDTNNFLKNVFLVEKFAEKNGAKVLHCFAEDKHKLPNADAYTIETLKTVWPEWSKDRSKQSKRQFISKPSLAKDGIHYGVEHHNAFGKQIYYTFRTKLK